MSRYTQFISPVGVARFPHLNEPDDYKGALKYKTGLIVSREEAQSFITQCEQELKKFVESHNKSVTESGKGKKLNLQKAMVTGLPFDEHPEDDSKVIFKLSQHKELTLKKNGVEKKVEVNLIHYDSSGKVIENPPAINGGSKVQIAGSMKPYEGFGGGISLSIYAVMIHSLAQREAPEASALGFSVGASGGFVAEAPEEFEEQDEGTAQESGKEEQEDF